MKEKNKHFLTIAILFCDKDCYKIVSLVDSISKYKNTLDFEILLFDNRENNKDLLKFNNNVKVFSKGKNLYQLQGRKYLIKKATGKYIWFVDGDDEIKDLNIDINKYCILSMNYDIIYFNNYCDNKKIYNMGNKTITYIKNNILDTKVFNVVLWNKWIKTSILKKLLKYIPSNIKVVGGEDVIFSVGALKYFKSGIFIPNYIYNFTSKDSISRKVEISDLNDYKHLMIGHQYYIKILNKIFTKKEKSKLNLNNLILNDCYFYLQKASGCELPIIKEALDILFQEFDIEYIKNSWNKSQETFTLITGHILYKYFDKYYKNMFIPYINEYILLTGNIFFQKKVITLKELNFIIDQYI